MKNNTSERLNILFIFTDQHRLSGLGAYGPTPCRTPNLDRIAADGVRFENVYTSCPVCSPARGTIMTGLYPHGHGITTNIHEVGCSVNEISDRPELLSRRLQQAGYACGYTGKWHLGTDQSTTFAQKNRPCLPRDVGFDGQNFPGHGGGGWGYPEFNAYLQENNLSYRLPDWDEPTRHVWPMAKFEGPEEAMVPHWLTSHTISLIDRYRQESRPFFMWHNFWGPHGPFYASESQLAPYRNLEIPPWPNYAWPSTTVPGPHHAKIHPWQASLNWDDWAMAIRYYYAFTTFIDKQIGRLFDHLERTGELERTIIVFSADHGQTLGSHGGLSDKGFHHFEETHRIPLLIRFPNGRYQGRVVKELVSLTDLYPTFLELAGDTVAAAQDSVHGRSLLPLLENQAAPWRDCVVTEFHGLFNVPFLQRTLRCGKLKYGYNGWAGDELYDLDRDPHETVNLIADRNYAESAQSMRNKLIDWMKEHEDPALRRTKLFFERYESRQSLPQW